jgi:hypothetical protein
MSARWPAAKSSPWGSRKCANQTVALLEIDLAIRIAMTAIKM